MAQKTFRKLEFTFKRHLNFRNKSKFILFENHRKSRIQHCERSELRLHFECTKVPKVHKNAQMVHFGEFLKT